MLALIGGLFAVLMTLVFVAPADGTDGLGHPLYQISPTSPPYNTIVEITIPGYDDYTGKTALGRCTGWLYAPNMVATAGHCVYDKTAVINGYFDTRGIRVWPGVNGSTTNAQSCGVVKSFVPANWTAGQSRYVYGNEAFDYGAFKLDCSPALQPALKYGLPPTVTDFTRICGYPKNKATDTQWCSDDQVRAFDAYQVFYSNDTCVRMSGAPVMVWKNSEWNVTAIHSTHTHGTAYNHYTYNHGTRITSTVSADLTTWMNDTSAGTPPNPPAQPQPISVSPYCDAPPTTS
ncbi:trypsin-like serine peptidase [Jatrophihabitans sp.]|uniref:trypsin-like serine peptidase n=1 Tax=Jatrophihabitans sp. TaxID=1932789 RepID=UPI002EE98BB6